MKEIAREKITKDVAAIIRRVRKDGDLAVIRFAKIFDGVNLQSRQLKISPAIIKEASKKIDSAMKTALTICAARIKSFHLKEKKSAGKSWAAIEKGVKLGQIVNPVESVGVYVPGGRFSYPSTVLMTVIPAKVAGVKRIALVSPPKNITPELLVAAGIAGVSEIYQVGGVQAIAALAIGTKTIPKVDLIIGPGNAYVTEAKRQLFGEVGIDLLAGPSELVVLADRTAKPEFVAADMAAQAEHDPMSRAILISTDNKLVASVRNLLPKAKLSQCRLIYQPNMAKAVGLVNNFAGEHVGIFVKNSVKIVREIKNGGAIFVGPYSPAVMGDYWAGPSHVLPTGRSARFSSGLSVANFLKRSSLIQITPQAFRNGGKFAYKMAMAEGLREHANSIKIRLQ